MNLILLGVAILLIGLPFVLQWARWRVYFNNPGIKRPKAAWRIQKGTEMLLLALSGVVGLEATL